MSHRPHLGHSLERTVLHHRRPDDLQRERQASTTFGQRAADVVSTFAGSWRFIGIYIALTILWCGFNLVSFVKHWDPYPYIFYTFGVSVLAILLSSLILLAGNRQAEVDREHAENAYRHVDEVNAKQDEQLTILSKQLELIERQIQSGMQQHGEILDRLSTVLSACQALAPADGKGMPAARGTPAGNE